MSASKLPFRVSPGAAVTLGSGAPAGAGDEVKVDPSDPVNARLIAATRLIALAVAEKREPTKAELQDKAKVLDIDGRSTMNVEQLAVAISAAEEANAAAAAENVTVAPAAPAGEGDGEPKPTTTTTEAD